MTDSEDHSQRESSEEDDIRKLLPVVQDKLIETFSEKLNLSEYEVRSLLLEDKKLWQIAYDHGFSLQESEWILIEASKETLARAVKQGWMDPAQYFPVENSLYQQFEMELESA